MIVYVVPSTATWCTKVRLSPTFWYSSNQRASTMSMPTSKPSAVGVTTYGVPSALRPTWSRNLSVVSLMGTILSLLLGRLVEHLVVLVEHAVAVGSSPPGPVSLRANA